MSHTHAIMFHHFHDDTHVPVQGSLSAREFGEMLDWLSARYNMLGAREYLNAFEAGRLSDRDICLTFDDALLCQWDIAVPVLNARGLGAYFFVYSSVFTGQPDLLEVFRYFRTSQFKDIDEFYAKFFERAQLEDKAAYRAARETYLTLDYLSAFPFYSEADKWFRYLRDQLLGPEAYRRLMFALMDEAGYDIEEASSRLWMKDEHLKALHDGGHLVGLHSHTHPTQMSRLPAPVQADEYGRNLKHLEGVLGAGSIVSMSHPCGDYNDDTLSLLNGMGVRIGFRSSLSVPEIKSPLEIPRDDHANIYRAMHP